MLACPAFFGVVSRRQPDPTDLEWRQIYRRWEEALAASDAMIICTENAAHERYAKAAIAAGKHVIVEFPLTLNPDKAAELFQLADNAGVILHVQHIELMSAGYRALRDMVWSYPAKLKRAEVGFTGPPTDPSWGPLPYTGMARLHRILEICGDDLHLRDFMYHRGEIAAAGQATMSSDSEHSQAQRMSVTLRSAQDVDILWTEWRAPGLKRENTWRFEFADGHVIDQMPQKKDAMPLFLADLEVFIQKTRGQRDQAEYRGAVLHGLRMAEFLTAMCSMYPMWHWTDRAHKPPPDHLLYDPHDSLVIHA